jgi:Family of unknown function (DUF6492)
MTSRTDGHAGAPLAPVDAFDAEERAESRSAPSAGDGSMCLVTPTYWRDLELCELLCESIDRYVTSFDKHCLIVADEEMELFAKFNGPRREVLPASRFLPKWLKPLPAFLRRKSRRYWWSLRAMPVSGWHVQQLIKLAAAVTLPFERFCIIDSDVVFFRPFDLSPYLRPHPIPAFYTSDIVTTKSRLQAPWVRCAHDLLGLGPARFPADDFIGHIIFWDQRTARCMLARIERVSGVDWVQALCRRREFSEYNLYGYFQRTEPAHTAQHFATTQLPCASYWEYDALDPAKVRDLLSKASEHQVAFSVSSASGTPVEVIRAAFSSGS